MKKGVLNNFNFFKSMNFSRKINVAFFPFYILMKFIYISFHCKQNTFCKNIWHATAHISSELHVVVDASVCPKKFPSSERIRSRSSPCIKETSLPQKVFYFVLPLAFYSCSLWWTLFCRDYYRLNKFFDGSDRW